MTLRFHPEHTWARDEGGGIATVGITQHAQETLGDIVFADLPAIGLPVTAGTASCVVESVKTAADVFAPVSGVVVEVNEALRADPSLANSSPENDGWFYKLRVSNPADLLALMDEATYRPFAEST